MCGDERRKHGDAFPLPSHALKTLAFDQGVSEAQRAFWIGDCLNKLAQSPLNSDFSVLRSNLPLTAVQRCVADRVCESLLLHGDCPSDCDAESALLSLKGGKPCYDGAPNNLANYDPKKLKILDKGAAPKHILNFLPTGIGALVKSYQREILTESCPDTASFRPYWDPALRYDGGKRLDFIHRLFRAGLMELRPVAGSFVGAFFVKKKSPDQIRMVIDCRGTNNMCGDPPVTRLASSRCYMPIWTWVRRVMTESMRGGVKPMCPTAFIVFRCLRFHTCLRSIIHCRQIAGANWESCPSMCMILE